MPYSYYMYKNPQPETRFWFTINLLTFALVETLGSNKFTPPFPFDVFSKLYIVQ